MGRSNGKSRAGAGANDSASENANGTAKKNEPQVKRLSGIAAIVLAIVCSAFGLTGLGGQGSVAGDSSQTTTAAVQTAQPQASDSSAGQQGGQAGATLSLTFRSPERLEEHFRKHGAELGYATAEDYLAGANAVIANPDALYKTQAEDGDDAYYLEATGEFVVVSQKGYIRTYFLATRDYWDRQ